MAGLTVELCIGRTSTGTASIVVADPLIEAAQDSMSEFEVLEMAMHDAHYAGGRMSRLTSRPNVVPPPFLVSMNRKTSASNVTGNLGEGIGLATLVSLSGIRLHHVVRVRRQRGRTLHAARRTPDYVVSLPGSGSGLRAVTALFRLTGVGPSVARKLSLFPDRFPVEAKATFGNAGAFWSATWQLVEYWSSMEWSTPGAAEIGYGIVASVEQIGTPNRLVRLHVLAPKDPAAFRQCVAALRPERGTKKALDEQFAVIGGWPFVG